MDYKTEVYLEINRQLSIELRNQEIETVEEASSHGVGIRVLTKNRMAFASCNDFQEKSLEETITRAITMSRFTTADENNVLPQEKGFSDFFSASNQECWSQLRGK